MPDRFASGRAGRGVIVALPVVDDIAGAGGPAEFIIFAFFLCFIIINPSFGFRNSLCPDLCAAGGGREQGECEER